VPAVRTELLTGEDALHDWVERLPNSFWVSESLHTVQAMQRLAIWVTGERAQYTPAAIDQFLSSADMRLIAESIAGNDTVVTLEQSKPGARRRILIPDVCTRFSVRRTTPWSLHQLGGLQLTHTP